MSEQNVQTLLRIVEAFNREDWDAARRDFETGGEWPPAEPGSEETSYFSYEGIRNYLQSWVDNFDNFRLEVTELVEAGEEVFVVVRVLGQGRQSGEETNSPPHPLLARFEGGKIVGLTLFMSREAALRAAGLSEHDTQK